MRSKARRICGASNLHVVILCEIERSGGCGRNPAKISCGVRDFPPPFCTSAERGIRDSVKKKPDQKHLKYTQRVTTLPRGIACALRLSTEMDGNPLCSNSILHPPHCILGTVPPLLYAPGNGPRGGKSSPLPRRREGRTKRAHPRRLLPHALHNDGAGGTHLMWCQHLVAAACRRAQRHVPSLPYYATRNQEHALHTAFAALRRPGTSRRVPSPPAAPPGPLSTPRPRRSRLGRSLDGPWQSEKCKNGTMI